MAPLFSEVYIYPTGSYGLDDLDPLCGRCHCTGSNAADYSQVNVFVAFEALRLEEGCPIQFKKESYRGHRQGLEFKHRCEI
jgi:hypothetical protein